MGRVPGGGHVHHYQPPANGQANHKRQNHLGAYIQGQGARRPGQNLPQKADGQNPPRAVRLFDDDLYWEQVRDSNPAALKLFQAHYSKYHYKDGRRPNRFVGPGERIVLLGKQRDALFVWRKFISDDGQQGVNNSIFINQAAVLSSTLILEAERIAWAKWPGQRFYTYVDPRAIRSVNPGCCYKKAGWRVCGVTQKRSYLILEKTPPIQKYFTLSL